MKARSYLIIPFVHQFTDEQLVSLPTQQMSPWRHWFCRLNKSSDPYKSLRAAFDYSYSLMPWARNLLHPEFIGLETADIRRVSSAGVTGNLSEIRQKFAEAGSFIENQYIHRATRLTWTGDLVSNSEKLRMRYRHRGINSDIELRLAWIDAFLFPDQIGVLVSRVEILDDLDLEKLASAMRHLKKLTFRRRLEVDVPDLVTSDGEKTTWLDLIDDMLNLLNVDRSLDGSRVADELRQTIGVTWTHFTIPYVDRAEIPGQVTAPFDSYLEEVAVSVATGKTYIDRVDNHISDSFIEEVRSGSELRMWDSWIALHHWDSLVMPVLRGSDELNDIFDRHLENTEYEYLLVFILAIAQNAYFDLFSAQLAEFSGELDAASQNLATLEQALVRIQTRSWHPRVSATPVGQPLADTLKASLALDDRFSHLSQRISTLKAHLTERRNYSKEKTDARLSLALQLLTFVLLPVTVGVTVFQPLFNRFPPSWGTIALWIPWALLGGLTAILIVIVLLLRRAQATRDAEF